DLLLEDIAFYSFDKLVRVLRQLALPVAQLLDPGNHLAGREARASAFLHIPVAGDSAVRDTLHLMRANLNLRELVIQAKDRGMQGLIAIEFWRSDEILDAPI